ncbi:MAG: hypothetical protein ACLRFN_01645 [Alphaproteobacteria bacterium]
MPMKHVYKKKHKKKPTISDHAIVQFLHRTEVLDIKKLRAELMTKGLRKAIQYTRDNEKIVEYNENGLQFIVEKGCVKTIIPADMLRYPNGDIVKVQDGMKIL